MARPGIGSLLLAGAAAFGLYKISKMSQQQKDELLNKGKKLYEENVPENVKSLFGKKENEQSVNTHSENSYTQQV